MPDVVLTGANTMRIVELAACPATALAHHRTLEMACAVLGLDPHDARGLTVTGGLPYAGGPGSAYTLHSLARMMDILRSEPEQLGLVTGNGWYLSTHSSVVLGGPRWSSVVLGGPRRAPVPPPSAWRARALHRRR